MVCVFTEVQLIPKIGSYISCRGKFLNISYTRRQKGHRIPATEILFNYIAAMLDFVPHIFKIENIQLGKVAVQQSFKHVFLTLNGFHKVEGMLKAFHDLEPHVSKALGE